MLMMVESIEECQGSDEMPWLLDLEEQDIGIEIYTENKKLKKLIEEPPEVDLKKLSNNFEYVFLVEASKLLVIISSHLSCD